MVLSGDRDLLTTVADTMNLYVQLPEPKQLYFIEGASHDDLEHFDSNQYWSVVEPFIREHINGDV